MDTEPSSSDSPVQRALAAATDALKRSIRDHVWDQIGDSVPPDPQRMIAFVESLAVESDRAVPVLAYSYLEQTIGELLRSHLNPRVHGGLSDLFAFSGPLGTTSAQLRIAQAFGWLADGTASDIHILRKIRNDMAHDPEANLTDSAAQRLQNHRGLNAVKKALTDQGPDAWESSGTRADYVLALVTSWYWGSIQLFVAPAALRSGADPNDLIQHDEEHPESLKRFRESSAALLRAVQDSDT